MKNEKNLRRECRRQQSILTCTGIGVIAFGLWDIMNFVLYFLFDRNDFVKVIPEDIPEELVRVVLILSAVLVIGMMFLAMLIRIKFANIAIRYGRGGGIKHPKRFFILAFLYLCIQVSTVYECIVNKTYGFGMADRIMSLIVSITGISIFGEMLLAGIKLRRYEKELINM